MKFGVLLLAALFFSACTTLSTEKDKLSRGDQELAQIYQGVVNGEDRKEEIKLENTKEIVQEKKEEKEEIQEKQVVKNSLEKKILFVGDSVMKGSEAQLQKMYPNAIIDSSVSRQFTVLPEILRKIQTQNGYLPEIVVIHLGSNGTVQETQMEETMKLLGNQRKVFFINCKVEKPWQDSVNAFLKAQVQKYPNAKLVDWYHISAHQADYFAKDGVHPNPVGAKVYRAMIQEKLEKEL